MDRFSGTQAIQPNTNDGQSPACLQSRGTLGHAALLEPPWPPMDATCVRVAPPEPPGRPCSDVP